VTRAALTTVVSGRRCVKPETKELPSGTRLFTPTRRVNNRASSSSPYPCVFHVLVPNNSMTHPEIVTALRTQERTRSEPGRKRPGSLLACTAKV